MELHVWPSDFGLPSIDVSSLQFLACAKMCASPIQVISSKSPWNSPTGEYPVLFDKTNEKTAAITDFDKYVDVLRRSGQDVVIDQLLTSQDRAQLDAFFHAIFIKNLNPAVLQAFWADDLNYHTVTQHWYSSRLHFPYNLYYLEKRRKLAIRRLEGKSTTTVLKNAFQALNVLSTKLGDNKFFCGNKPTSLDALVFGYLAPLLRVQLPNDRLYVQLTACPNLVRFVETVSTIYLPLTEEQLKTQQLDRKMWQQRLQKAKAEKELIKNSETSAGEVSAAEEPPMRDSILFAVAAVTLSVLFALHSGIIQVTVEDDAEVIAE
ncbi:unnamed protein product [Caenorhabditis auriculariae]|uniref:GST C-terminal domain-containing protein n=1 Tax=Caenorhabditis auriculariae TaxID=2777116 RepID=A0A8S1GT29_9PELO|nr:unnamed protein product [Caenorhabditis auriculariae]